MREEINKIMYKRLTILSFYFSILIVGIHLAIDIFYGSIDVSSDIALNLVQFFRDGLARVGVPFFFFKSGLGFFTNYNSTNDYLRKIKTRFFTVGIPFLVWNGLCYIFNIMLTNMPIIKSYLVGRSNVELTLKSVMKALFLYSYNPVNWYLLAIIVLFLLGPIWSILLRKKAVALVCLIVMVFLPRYDCFFFFLGAVVSRFYLEQMNRMIKKKEASIALVLFVVGTILFYNTISKQPLCIQIIWLALELYLVWCSSALLAHRKEFFYYHASFLIYESQTITASIILKMLYIVLPMSSLGIIISFFGTLLLNTLICSVAYMQIQKKKILSLLLTGNR